MDIGANTLLSGTIIPSPAICFGDENAEAAELVQMFTDIRFEIGYNCFAGQMTVWPEIGSGISPGSIRSGANE